MPVSAEKAAYAEKLNSMLDKYERIIFCGIDNVRSMQLHNVRAELRGKGELLMGKNTLQKRVIINRAEENEAAIPMKEALVDGGVMVGNRGLLFTNESVDSIQAILKRHQIKAPARVGSIAPCDVIVPAGNTGMEPTMTTFFQALSIQTKIAKGTVEITQDKKVLSPGDKVDTSCAALLQKLKISPFWYQLEIKMMWEKGTMFTAEDLSITDDDIEAQAMTAINNLTALSLGSGVLTECSFPHVVMGGFKNLLAASVASEFVFEEFNGKQRRTDIIEGKGAAAAPAASAAAAPAAKKAAVVESSEDDEEMDSLF